MVMSTMTKAAMTFSFLIDDAIAILVRVAQRGTVRGKNAAHLSFLDGAPSSLIP
jgi:hypothetical protein